MTDRQTRLGALPGHNGGW